MALDRTYFNSLVDDTGAGDGTPVDKAMIDAIYDDVDAALAVVSSGAGVVQTTTSTGTQNDFALTASASLLRVNNASAITLTGLSAGADGQRLDVVSIGAGTVTISDQGGGSTAANRVITGLGEALVLTAGTGVARLVYDATTARWRVTAIKAHAWTAVAYASGNFTATGGGTFVVDSGDQVAFRYLKVGRVCMLNVVLNTFSITGTVTNLNIAVPVAIAVQAEVVGLLFDNSGTVLSNARVLAAVGSSIQVFRVDGAALTASINNSYLRFTIAYEW